MTQDLSAAAGAAFVNQPVVDTSGAYSQRLEAHLKAGAPLDLLVKWLELDCDIVVDELHYSGELEKRDWKQTHFRVHGLSQDADHVGFTVAQLILQIHDGKYYIKTDPHFACDIPASSPLADPAFEAQYVGTAMGLNETLGKLALVLGACFPQKAEDIDQLIARVKTEYPEPKEPSWFVLKCTNAARRFRP